MKISSLMYSEHVGDPRVWMLNEFELGDINLLVGKNSSGKSRLLSVIHGLARLISGQQREIWATGTYRATFSDGDDVYIYELNIIDSEVHSERLQKNDRELFARNSDGEGTIWAEKISSQLDFAVSKKVLVVQAKRDRVQHPDLELINDWASETRHFQFGSSFGRNNLSHLSELLQKSPDGDFDKPADQINIQQIYSRGWDHFGEPFDRAIIEDLVSLGYPCSDVGLAPLTGVSPILAEFGSIFVQEDGLSAKTTQINMSQGMFRALALSISLNALLFQEKKRTVLIDDIGEGLDYERSKAFIGILVSRATAAGFQLIMTSNDRFVMNAVPLKHWGVVCREGSVVNVVTPKADPSAFEEFETLGLSNFDFFSGEFFRGPPLDG